MRIPLLGGAYEAKSVIANAQRCVNLYPEMNSQDSPAPTTHYPTPGMEVIIPGVGLTTVRCTYRASNGDLYAVIGGSVYYVDPELELHFLGTISSNTTPVSMADNGIAIILVDDTNNGYAIDMVSRAFGRIVSPYFYGATRVDYVDTFFLLNLPATNEWYISLGEVDFTLLTQIVGQILLGTITAAGALYTDGVYPGVPLTGGTGNGATADITVVGGAVTIVTIDNEGEAYSVDDLLSADPANIGGTGSGFTYSVSEITNGAFDPLDIATKNGYPDPIASLIVMHREIWLIGELTTEIWYNAGAADFTFQEMPGAFIEHGCVAKYSVAAQDLSVYWLSQDKQGRAVVMRGAAYAARRISTHAIEVEFSKYPTISDAVGFTYQQEGHVFYVLSFPSANATWVYDQATELWHERAWTDSNGILNRWRANCAANAYGMNIVGDWQNGNIYELNLEEYVDRIDGNGPNTDGSYPISFIRSFPHIVEDGNRVFYYRFIADMDVGQNDGSIDGTTPTDPPMLSLRWSDTKGISWGDKIEQSLGAAGQYNVNVQFRRLGMARDRVFELSWSMPAKTALNGAFIEFQPAGT